jgi:glycerophosphoryl diester phosphodiesterase
MRRATNQTVAISFDAAALEMIPARSDVPVGFGIKPWNAAARREAARLAPEYLFVRADRIPPGDKPFWPGDWQWVVYVVDEQDTARALFSRGAALVETDRIGQMIPALAERATGNDKPA